MRLRGRQDKFYRRRRLLKSFQKSIERIFRDLVHFVDDVDFEAAVRRLIANVLDDLADLIDTAVRGAVDFENIDRVALRDLPAVTALAAGRRGRALITVDRLGQDT